MASFFSGDGRGKDLASSFSSTFLNPSRPKQAVDPDYDPKRIIPVGERKAAMAGLDPMEARWTRGAFLLAALTSVFVVVIVSTQHVTKMIDGKKETTSGVTVEAILIGAVILLFAILGGIALKRNRRTLVVFSLFLIGFGCTLTISVLGFVFIFFGGWLMLRAYRIQKFGTSNAKLAATQAATRPPRRERKAAAAAPQKPTGHAAPKANKRYTPKAPARKKVPKPVE